MRYSKRRRAEDEFVQYVVIISGWEHTYGIRASGNNRFEVGPYTELSLLKFSGSVIRPRGYRYSQAIVTLSGRQGMLDEPNNPETKAVGVLSARNQILDAYVFVPAERMSELLTLASTGAIQAASFTGTRLRYRKGTVLSLSLETDLAEEDG